MSGDFRLQDSAFELLVRLTSAPPPPYVRAQISYEFLGTILNTRWKTFQLRKACFSHNLHFKKPYFQKVEKNTISRVQG